MYPYLSSKNFPCDSDAASQQLEERLAAILRDDTGDDRFALMAKYQRILANNHRKPEWPAIHEKLRTLFMCGRAAPLNGPMIGIPVGIRDSDLLRQIARQFGRERSAIASVEVLATAWNETFADTGLWMGKTFEPVSREAVMEICRNDPDVMAAFDANITRVGRNFFRVPPDPNLLQALGIPTITQAWHLKDRPATPAAEGYTGALLQENLDAEKVIPYSKTGGFFLADMNTSVLPEMQGKRVYGLNYRWIGFRPVFPMSCLVDELVQIDDGLYLGQLIYATRHFSLGTLDTPFLPDSIGIQLGEPYAPHSQDEVPDYGYQNNGYFLMMAPAHAQRIYADTAFPQLRPRPGEHGYRELGYGQQAYRSPGHAATLDWACGWRDNAALRQKFTTLTTVPSTRSDDGEVRELLHDGESVLQMLQRISVNISVQTNLEDNLRHFESLHRLFRAGIAPTVRDGVFQGVGEKGCNVRIEGQQARDWYGEKETSRGFDYYHGANLNLHCGFADKFKPDRTSAPVDLQLLPGILGAQMAGDEHAPPNLLNIIWHGIGKYIFPWAGKSFETISPRKLSMLLDESADLAARYPQRVNELQMHPASAPHYLAVQKDAQHFWPMPGRHAAHLSHSWDQGMSESDRAYWRQQADTGWVMGYNLQDRRILAADALFKLADINYRVPDAALQQPSEASGSPFVRQGYAFLGAADQESILPINNSLPDRKAPAVKKRVFQFHYRYPLIGGPAPIGLCLDELVEIAEGLFLGQLIYSTALLLPFHSGVDPRKYEYQLFGYFLLLDDDWERHRQAIGLDTLA